MGREEKGRTDRLEKEANATKIGVLYSRSLAKKKKKNTSFMLRRVALNAPFMRVTKQTGNYTKISQRHQATVLYFTIVEFSQILLFRPVAVGCLVEPEKVIEISERRFSILGSLQCLCLWMLYSHY